MRARACHVLLHRRRCEGYAFSGAEVSGDVAVPLWSKMVLLATNAGLSAAARQPVRAAYDDPAVRPTAIAALREVEAMARARGVRLPADVVERQVELSLSFPADLYASMYYDLERGRPLELDGLSGVVCGLGDELGVETPVHDTIYAVLKPFKDGRPRRLEDALP